MSFVRCCFLAILIAAPAGATTFNVDNSVDFQSALTTAEANGVSDVINVAAGTYAILTTLTYISSDGQGLTISGAGMASTILDGGDAIQVMVLSDYESGASIRVENLKIINGANSLSSGGALNIETGSGLITLSSIEVNDSGVTGTDHIGGGAALVADPGNIEITGCAFRRNSSEANVGGLYAATTSGEVMMSSSVFEDNSVDNVGSSEYFGDGGGAMLNTEAGGVTSVNGCTFTGNTAAGGSNPDAAGLMVYQLGTGVSATVKWSTFSGNQAELGGGGLFMRVNGVGSIVCNNNHFTSNSTLIGDGAGAFLYLDTGTLTATDNIFEGNTAFADGGGMWISHSSGNSTLSGNRFVSNSAGNNGGAAVFVSDSANAMISKEVFRLNNSGGVGGAFSYATTSGSLDLSRSTFYGNTSTSADGGGIYLYLDTSTAPVTMTDLIFWQNLPDQLAFSGGTGTPSITVEYSDIEGGSGGDPWFGTGCIAADPSFVDSGAGDLRLRWDDFPNLSDPNRSPCIDSGDPLSSLDPDGTRADMGALFFDQATIFDDGFESSDTSAWSQTVW